MPQTIAVTTVMRSSVRSSAVPPDSVLEPPNMSDNPLPFPECIKIVMIRNNEDKMSSTTAMALIRKGSPVRSRWWPR